MKNSILILAILVVFTMAPVTLPAAESKNADPLMGAVEFGSNNEVTGLVWKTGRINTIDDTGMVVDDVGYVFAPDVKFFGATGVKLTRMNFFPGMTVKFVLDNDLRTVLSLVKR